MVEDGFKLDIVNENERLVAGWASVEIVDRQGELVPVEVLTRAMIKFMDRGGLINYGHENKPVGKVLYWDVREHSSGKKGIYIIAKINSGYKIDDIVWNMIKLGKLKGFSIAGTGNVEKTKVNEGDKVVEVNVLKDVELIEISIVEEPANPFALIEQVSFAKGMDRFGDVKEKLERLADFTKGISVEDVKELVEEFEKCDFYKAIEEVFVDDIARIIVGKRFNELNEIERGRVEDMLFVIRKMMAVRDLELREIRKPFLAWDSFDDCVKDMIEQYGDEETARRVCGRLQAEYEKMLKAGDVTKRVIDVWLDMMAMKYNEVAELLKELKEIKKPEDLRPPKEWFYHCVERVSGKVSSPEALCGWIYYHHLKPYPPEGADDKPITEEARARKRRWLAERGG